jgi:hypothetical protein
MRPLPYFVRTWCNPFWFTFSPAFYLLHCKFYALLKRNGKSWNEFHETIMLVQMTRLEIFLRSCTLLTTHGSRFYTSIGIVLLNLYATSFLHKLLPIVHITRCYCSFSSTSLHISQIAKNADVTDVNFFFADIQTVIDCSAMWTNARIWCWPFRQVHQSFLSMMVW